ncbi:hypothetical protein QBC39DRAFT_411268, partial [Podospora conica]
MPLVDWRRRRLYGQYALRHIRHSALFSLRRCSEQPWDNAHSRTTCKEHKCLHLASPDITAVDPHPSPIPFHAIAGALEESKVGVRPGQQGGRPWTPAHPCSYYGSTGLPCLVQARIRQKQSYAACKGNNKSNCADLSNASCPKWPAVMTVCPSRWLYLLPLILMGVRLDSFLASLGFWSLYVTGSLKVTVSTGPLKSRPSAPG